MMIDDFARDVTYAVRSLARSRGFTVAAVLTLSIGIGATTAIYSVVDTVLLQPLPFTDSDRLVRLVENIPSSVGPPVRQSRITHHEFLDWRAKSRTLSDATEFVAMGQRMVRTPDGATGLWGSMVAPNTFTLFGAHALIGRTLTPEDDTKPDVVVLSFDTWQRHFRSDPAVIGTALEFRAGALVRSTARLLTVVGVMPAGFEFPGQNDFFTPIVLNASQQSLQVNVIGRLAPGVSLDAALQEANVMGNAIRGPWPADRPALTVPRFEVQGLKEKTVRELRPALRVLLAAVIVVLLIVCANVANLLLARGTDRQREVAVRLAIGATRGDIVRQILTECLVLACVGGVLGALIGAGGIALVKQLATVEAPGIFKLMFGATLLPRGQELAINAKVIGIAFSLAAITSVVFGLLPALHLARTNHLHAMGSRGSGHGRAESRLRSALVVGQLVMATVLLVGAGLLSHSFVKLSNVNKGYDAENVLAVQLLFPDQYSLARKTETIETIASRLRGQAGVRSAGFSRHGMLIGEELTLGAFVPPGRTREEMAGVKPRVRSVSDGFLTAMGVPLVDGREFSEADARAALPSLVINRAAARRLFGSAGAVGQTVDWYLAPLPVQATVIGVVEDVLQESLSEAAYPEIYVDYRQLMRVMDGSPELQRRKDEWAIGFLSFAIRTEGDPAAAVPTVRETVRAVDPNIGIDAIIPMTRLVASSVARQRFYAVMLGVFAAVAGLLAAIGIYAVLAYAVVQRRQEIGVRMALGAQRSRVLTLVLTQGLLLTGVGVLLGLAGAAAASRFLQGMLFGLTPLDATTYISVALTFALVAACASYLPARRATMVDPVVALRAE
jgi:putative ABC transport system permease protein